VKASFAKSALFLGLFAGTTMDASAVTYPATGDIVQIGCTVPSQGFGGATVYSIDKAGLTFAQTAVAAGTICTKAINALTSGYSASTSGATFEMTANTNIVVPGTGYSLQQFTLSYTTSPTAAMYSMVGCTAPAATGGTVYSVDSRKGYGTSSVISANTAIAVGANCSSALNELNDSVTVQSGQVVTDSGTYALLGSSNVTISTNGYSLQQFLMQ